MKERGKGGLVRESFSSRGGRRRSRISPEKGGRGGARRTLLTCFLREDLRTLRKKEESELISPFSHVFLHQSAASQRRGRRLSTTLEGLLSERVPTLGKKREVFLSFLKRVNFS